MQAQFTLAVDGIEGGELNRRALGLTWSDKGGITSDSLTITLDDAEGRLAIPRKGVQLSAKLGYAGRLVALPEFVVDEVELAGPLRQMIIKARSANLRDRFKEYKTRSWNGVTLGELVAEIASDNGLTPVVAEGLKAHPFAHIDQTNESDLNLLTRLALELHAVAKPVGSRLLFMPAAQARSASGKQLPEVAITAGACDSWRVTLPDRSSYTGAEARWQDLAAGAEQLALAGNRSGAIARLPGLFAGEAEATAAAAARLGFLQRQGGAVSLTIDGNPSLRAEAPLRLSGFRPGVDGVWTIDEATHSAGRGQRYTTQIKAAPQAGA